MPQQTDFFPKHKFQLKKHMRVMKLKHFIMTAVTLLLPVTMQAQTDFEEVVYTPQHTVFKLNSPTSPVKVGSFNGTSEDEEAQKNR